MLRVCLLRNILTIILLLQLPQALAKQVKIALTHIPKVMEYDTPDAPYTKLINVLRSEFGLEFEPIFLPSARANKLLNDKKIDCIFPIIPTSSRFVDTLFSSPVNGIRAHFFSKDGKQYKSIEELAGKTVVYLRGYLFADLIANNRQVSFLPVNSQQAAFMILAKQRADVYLEYIPDIRYTLSSEQMATLSYSKKHPIIKNNDRLECLTSERGKAFLKDFNDKIQILRASGELRKILGDYFVDINN
ncbi:MAG: transporter substrate-binding domain-containing protein [Gammaproteobacteria bacterium]|nr:transporter substrate-binding domain-containing protein [Gammaproteobacteria bacterium]